MLTRHSTILLTSDSLFSLAINCEILQHFRSKKTCKKLWSCWTKAWFPMGHTEQLLIMQVNNTADCMCLIYTGWHRDLTHIIRITPGKAFIGRSEGRWEDTVMLCSHKPWSQKISQWYHKLYHIINGKNIYYGDFESFWWLKQFKWSWHVHCVCLMINQNWFT